jgi:hypothetical protein
VGGLSVARRIRMKRIIVVVLAGIAVATCGSGQSLSGKYFIQNEGGQPSSMDFHSNGTVDVQGIFGLANTTYKFDGSQVSISLPLVPGTEPVLATYKIDSAGCLARDLPVVGTVKWCSQPFVPPKLR